MQHALDEIPFLGLAGSELSLILLLVLLSFLLGAAFFSKLNWQIGWATYLAAITLIHMGVLCIQLQWHFVMLLLSGSSQFIMGLLILLQIFMIGVLKAAAATARSNNAFGHTGYSWFALLPLFDLILIFSEARVYPRGRFRAFISEFDSLLLAIFLFFICKTFSGYVVGVVGG